MGVSAGYLVTASFMSAPAAVMFAKIMVPETGAPETSWSSGEGAKVSVPTARRQRHRRGGARRERGAAAGAQRRRHAHRVRRAGQHDRPRGVVDWRPVRAPRAQPRPHPRCAADAARLPDGRALEGRAAGRVVAGDQDRAQRVPRLSGDDQPRERARRRRASASPASRCAASPTSARWRSCSAAWAAWCPSGARIWRAWA